MIKMSEAKRIFYLDALRFMAILCVVLLHVTGHLAEITQFNLTTIYSLSGIFEMFMNNATRIGIGLFLALSGALILGREVSLKDHLTKRLTRLVKPFIFWSVVFTALLFFGSYFITGMNFIDDFSLFGFLRLLYNTLLFKAPGSAVYWFFWMMLGVYLIMPIFNRWISNSNLSEVEYFLIIWLITSIFDYTLMMPCPIKLSYFVSPIGFVLLGYYLRHTDRKIFNNVYVALLLTLIPVIIMFVYSYAVVDTKILFEFDKYSILVIAETAGVFCLFKTSKFLNNPNKYVKSLVSSFALCSYGMYLIHSQLIMVFRKILHVSFNFYMEYLILFFVGFVLSWLIILILSKIQIINNYAGVK